MSKPTPNEWRAEGGVARPGRTVRPGTREVIVTFMLATRDEHGEVHFFRCECDALDRVEGWEASLQPGRYVAIRGRWMTRPFRQVVRGHEVERGSMEYCHVDHIDFPEPPAKSAANGPSPLEVVANG